ncbi:HAD family hydrolase [Paenibacillus hodogayensis]|uniref:HAD family hydrolase n=1 Tax=Paenibacillus hodogayensis TaxID=279208 RepID=A0ABV5VWL8_9BACL
MKHRFTAQTTKAVFFDMNNTLIDPRASFDSCFLNVLADFAGRWDDGDGQWNPQQVLVKYREEWSGKAAPLRGKPEAAEAVKKQCLQAALRHYPFQVNDAFVASFFREMRHQARGHAVPFGDAPTAVAKLAGRYKIGVITNGSKEQQADVINRLGLSAHIAAERIFASDKGGVRKPNAAIFRSAARDAGVSPAQAVMIGDSWKNDVTGALKAGMPAVWLNRASAKTSSRRKVGSSEVPVVRSFKELTELFEL